MSYVLGNRCDSWKGAGGKSWVPEVSPSCMPGQAKVRGCVIYATSISMSFAIVPRNRRSSLGWWRVMCCDVSRFRGPGVETRFSIIVDYSRLSSQTINHRVLLKRQAKKDAKP